MEPQRLSLIPKDPGKVMTARMSMIMTMIETTTTQDDDNDDDNDDDDDENEP